MDKILNIRKLFKTLSKTYSKLFKTVQNCPIAQHWFKVLKGNTKLTNFLKYELNSFKVKIKTEELPILDNLIKRKLHIYDSKWKYFICLKDKKTYLHLWKCKHLRQVY